jgi:hypothetical protein
MGLASFLNGFGSEPPAWLAAGFEAASLQASRRERPTDSARTPFQGVFFRLIFRRDPSASPEFPRFHRFLTLHFVA